MNPVHAAIAPRDATATSAFRPASTGASHGGPPLQSAARWSVDGAAAPGERNHLLRLLAAESGAALAPLVGAAERVTLQHRAVLYEPGASIPYAYFPESAVCSMLKRMADGRQVEVGTVGHEGMLGLPLFFGGDAAPTLAVVQIPGEAVRVPAADFRAAVADSGTSLHVVLQHFAQYLYDQTAQTAACNRLHSIERRCARWLCMTHDRVGSSRFPLTQEFLATMLGVRRAGVTEAAGHLQEAALIRYRRGCVQVLDRAGLEAAACECYGADRADYVRLLGSAA